MCNKYLQWKFNVSFDNLFSIIEKSAALLVMAFFYNVGINMIKSTFGFCEWFNQFTWGSRKYNLRWTENINLLKIIYTSNSHGFGYLPIIYVLNHMSEIAVCDDIGYS